MVPLDSVYKKALSYHLTTSFFYTQCLLNVLCEMPKTNPLPKVIILSTLAVTPISRSQVPFLLKIFYGYMISGISHLLQDKLDTECVMCGMELEFQGWGT